MMEQIRNLFKKRTRGGGGDEGSGRTDYVEAIPIVLQLGNNYDTIDSL